MHNNFDVVVIGGGPAGCSAATFLARSKRRTLLVDRSLEGGFLGSLGHVSYFPGVVETINGKELLKKMRRQAELVGVSIANDAVTAISVNSQPFRVLTDTSKEFECRAIVVATGAAARTNYLHGEREFLGRGVSHDARSDGPAVAKRVVAVVGRTRQSAEEALILSRFAEKIHFVIPASKLDIDENIMKQIQNTRSIELHFSTSLKRINGGEHVNSITVFSIGQEKDLSVAGVFTYVHEYQTTTGFLEKIAELAPNGSVKVDTKFATSADGVFACGDVLCGKPQNLAVSTAQGVIAGVSADGFLAKFQ